MERRRERLLVHSLLLFCSICSVVSRPHVKELSGGNVLQLRVDVETGQYTLRVVRGGGVASTVFTSGATVLHTSSGWYSSVASSGTSSLQLTSSSFSVGTDALGDYQSISLLWDAALPFITEFKAYQDIPAIVFVQSFPEGASNISVGNNQNAASGFPSFSAYSDKLHFLTYQGSMAEAAVGTWPSAAFIGGIKGGSPLILYNQKLDTVVISPLSKFMVGAQILSTEFGGQFMAGPHGLVSDIPAGWSYSTLFYSGSGVSATVNSWGSLLLKWYGKTPTQFDADPIIKYLGYWTDNGGYYRYHTQPNKTYAETMVDLVKYIQNISLPVHNYQFDSWWYFKGEGNGTKLWKAMPSVFPQGMGAVVADMGMPETVLHNRYFDSGNDYLNRFEFVIERNIAVPLQEDLFLHIMGEALKWGMTVYEQDWLVYSFLNVTAMQSNVTKARTWMMAMGNAASKLGVTIQLCMALPAHILQSVEMQAVTQARVSGDYHTAGFRNQWKVGYTSLFYWSVGIVPFKDTFWSSEGVEEGCIYSWGCYEPNPEMEVTIAALTGGPVGPSDMIGRLNRTRIMQSCREDGLLLKPDRPAFPLDSVFSSQFGTASQPEMIEIWSTYSRLGASSSSSYWEWHYLFAANLSQPFVVHPSDLGITNTPYILYDYHASPFYLQPFNETTPLVIPEGIENPITKVIPFHYYILCPILPNGWTVLGEKGKTIAMSKQRFKRMEWYEGGIELSFTGSDREGVSILLLPPGVHTPIEWRCRVQSNQVTTLKCRATDNNDINCACLHKKEK